MAIAFARVTIHSRSKGHSAVAASAYRTATKLYDERTGITYDYSNRSEIAFSEIMLPHGASEQFHNREFLWNEVERSEKRINSQLCKDVVLALPKELTTIQHIELARRFAQLHFVDNGLVCDVAIHDDDDGNPHAHILVTLRRLEGQHFSKYKARDLNPQFAKGFIVEQDYWHDEWRSFQNDYFQEMEIGLTVDLNHLIAEKHAGRSHDAAPYLHEENKLIKMAREELALDSLDNLINRISLTHSVFTRRDIEKLLFKTLRSEINSTQYLTLVEKFLAHHDVICLGANDRGIESYTTRHQYIAESKLLNDVEALQKRGNHIFSNTIDPFVQGYKLNEEQSQAFSFITQGEDISILIGRPGVGKSYLLKPLKEYYETNQCRVIGTSLSGKVAKSLQTETGIESSTIASLTYRINHDFLKLDKNDVLVIDEAGMVDFASMAYLLSEANKAQCKVILVGDPDQLKPIQKGEIFRGIAQHTGYFELANIQRQQHEGDRHASLNLAKGFIDAALTHYVERDAVTFSEDQRQAQIAIVGKWFATLTQCDMKEHIMLAFTRKAVLALNERARLLLQENQQLSSDNYSYSSDGGKQAIKLDCGERILFRQNNKLLGIRNGDLATITEINPSTFKANLDSGEQVSIPVSYKYIDYGYALTVHKSQGMTVDLTSVLIDSTYWDKFLSFVAMTRHRKNLFLYADTHQHPDLKALSKTMSRAITKDNVIDWPLDFAIRAGFNPDKLIGRALNKIAGVGHKIKEKYNYIVNFETYAHQKTRELKKEEQQKIRIIAKKLADFGDEQAKYMGLKSNLLKQAKVLKTPATSLNEFKAVYQQSTIRDQKAHALWNGHRNQLSDFQLLKFNKKDIQKSAERHERYLTIKELIEHKLTTTIPEQLVKRIHYLDLKRDKIHIMQLCSQNNQNSNDQLWKIKTIQRTKRELIFNER